MLGSKSQQVSLTWALGEFVDAHLRKNGSGIAPTLLASSRDAEAGEQRMSGLPALGIANLNLNHSRPLFDFSDNSSAASLVVTIPADLSVSTIAAHTRSQYQQTIEQINAIGLPPFYAELLGGVQIPIDMLELAKNVQFDEGIVISLPSAGIRPEVGENGTASSNKGARIAQLRIPLRPSSNNSFCATPRSRSVQIDLARRSNCFLPTLASNVSLASAKACAKPRLLHVSARLEHDNSSHPGVAPRSLAQRTLGTNFEPRNETEPSAGPGGESQNRGRAEIDLKARFTFEWGPYGRVPSPTDPSAGKIGLSTLPVVWETLVIDAGEQLGREGSLEAILDVSGEGDEGEDFLYIGAIRGVCS